MKYWLFKSEPSCFGIDDLAKCPRQISPWDGVRNYQARNMMRDEMQVGDRGFFYHSSCKATGIVGLVEIVKAAYPDHTQFDPQADHFDPTSSPADPRWFMVDVKILEKFDRVLSLQELRENPLLSTLVVLRKGNRLSITPVAADEYQVIMSLL
jgi:predicted RNA-binding protein with PUA-like domain